MAVCGIRVWTAGLIAMSFACAPEDRTAALADDMDYLSRAEAVLALSSRPTGDRMDDQLRKPAEVLAFIGIEPGMTVFEMEAGQGYYTELLSALVGPEGEVTMQSPEALDVFLADPIAARLKNNRLPNVRLSKTPFDKLDADDNSVDIVTWLLGPHELYFTPAGGGHLGDPRKTYAEVMRILKPGGTFVILDHAAAPDAPQTTGGSLHRIDPAIVKALVSEAGFSFVSESTILQYADDEYTMSVFDPAVRRKTDRFLLKYQKPE